VSGHKTLTELMIPPVGVTHQALETYRNAVKHHVWEAEEAKMRGYVILEHHHRCEARRIAKLIPRDQLLQVVS
jgi:hypothetical protein